MALLEDRRHKCDRNDPLQECALRIRLAPSRLIVRSESL